jgi:hypothetical protein
MAEKPGRPLVLTKEAHALLGELVEIMGSIEDMVIKSAARVDAEAALRIGQVPAGLQASIWAQAVTGRAKDPKMEALIPSAQKELESVAEERNSFIHALFTNDYVDGYVEPGYQTAFATRSKNGRTRPTSDLGVIRDRAAKLSRQIAQIVNAI